MSIIAGQKVAAAVDNAAFLSRLTNSDTIAKIDFKNSETASGGNIINIQRVINSISSAFGISTNEAYNFLVSWSENYVGSINDTAVERISALVSLFSGNFGHDHSGVDGSGKKVSASNLDNFNKYYSNWQSFSMTGVSGSSVDVSSFLLSKSPTGSSNSIGVVITAPNNKVSLYNVDDGSFLEESPGGDRVYGRLSYSVGIWTVTFYKLVSGIETSTSISLSNITFVYLEVFDQENRPTFPDTPEFGSLDGTADVKDATYLSKGKVQLSSTVSEISSTGSAGTSNAIVSNADHSHKGVHSLKIDGESAQAFGDVEFKEGTGIDIQWDSGKIKISSNGGGIGYQETPVGLVNGSNAVFGPLTYLPSDDNSVLVFIDVYPVPLTTGYSITSGTITFNAGYIPQPGQTVYVFYLTSGTPTVPVMTGTFRTEYRTITLGEETAKNLTLSFTPSTPSYVIVDVIGGSAQEFATDFTVSGSVLSWSGLALDGVLTTGDKLRICYVT